MSSERAPVESGTVQIIDLVLFDRRPDGVLAVLDVEDQSTSLAPLADLATDPRRLLNDEDLELLAESVPDGRSGVAAVLEHVWASALASDLRQHSAELTLSVRVPAADVDAAFAAEEGS